MTSQMALSVRCPSPYSPLYLSLLSSPFDPSTSSPNLSTNIYSIKPILGNNPFFFVICSVPKFLVTQIVVSMAKAKS